MHVLGSNRTLMDKDPMDRKFHRTLLISILDGWMKTNLFPVYFRLRYGHQDHHHVHQPESPWRLVVWWAYSDAFRCFGRFFFCRIYTEYKTHLRRHQVSDMSNRVMNGQQRAEWNQHVKTVRGCYYENDGLWQVKRLWYCCSFDVPDGWVLNKDLLENRQAWRRWYHNSVRREELIILVWYI